MIRRTSGGSTHNRTHDERGYVMALTALMLIPMLVFTAFATDVGAWYVRAQEIQRAADAAALAAVVWMPDEDQAIDVALDVAARNGFVDQPGEFDAAGVDLPQVRVSRVGNQRVRVDIKAEGELYFGSVVESFDEPTIHRFATAEYVLPVPIGNPTSSLGGGADNPFGTPENFWLRAMSDCESRQTGDFVGSASPTCPATATPVNPNHVPEGHAYVLDIPEGAAGRYRIQTRLTCAFFGGDQANASMSYTLYPPDDTPLDDLDNATNNAATVSGFVVDRPADSICDVSGDGTVQNLASLGGGAQVDWTRASDPAPWINISNVPLAAGRWLLYADNPDDANDRSLYSLRLDPIASSGTVCTRIGSTADADCPNISAVDYLTVYSHGQMFDPAAGGVAELYLGEVAEIHAGKVLQITMFDPAEGIDVTRILEPDGTPATFSWRTIDVDEWNYTGHAFELVPTPTPQTCGGVSCVSQNSGDDGTNYSFQNRTIRIEIDIPNDYSCVAVAGQPDNCWWKVQYVDSNLDANETTTWGIKVIGDPVRLIE